MPVPDFQSFMLPLLKRTRDGQEHSLRSFRAELSSDMQLTTEDVENDMLPSGTQTRYENRIYWAATYLLRAGCLERVNRGVFRITPRGEDVLATTPEKVTMTRPSQVSRVRRSP